MGGTGTSDKNVLTDNCKENHESHDRIHSSRLEILQCMNCRNQEISKTMDWYESELLNLWRNSWIQRTEIQILSNIKDEAKFFEDDILERYRLNIGIIQTAWFAVVCVRCCANIPRAAITRTLILNGLSYFRQRP